MTKDDFQAAAWASFIDYASRTERFRRQFEKDTKKKFTAENMEDFVRWATVKCWGLDEAPKAYRDSITGAAA